MTLQSNQKRNSNTLTVGDELSTGLRVEKKTPPQAPALEFKPSSGINIQQYLKTPVQPEKTQRFDASKFITSAIKEEPAVRVQQLARENIDLGQRAGFGRDRQKGFWGGLNAFSSATTISTLSLFSGLTNFTAGLIFSDKTKERKELTGLPKQISENPLLEHWRGAFKDAGMTTQNLTGKFKDFTNTLQTKRSIQPTEGWNRADTAGKFSKKYIGETLFQLGPSVVASVGVYALNPAFGIATIWGATADDVKDTAIAYGVENNKAELLGLSTGLAVAALDRIVPNKIFKGNFKLKNQFIGGFARRMGESAILEGGTEVLQENLQLWAESTFRDDMGFDEIATRNAMAGLGGVLGGSGMQLLVSFANDGQRAEILETIKKKPFGLSIEDVSGDQDPLAKEAEILRGTKGLTADQITQKFPNIKLTKDVVAKDVAGNKVTIDKGEALTPYELKDGKILLQDGETYLVSKNQFQNIKGQAVSGEAKKFAPELKELEESVRSARDGTEELIQLRKDVDSGKISEFEYERLKKLNTETLDTKYSQYQLPGGENYKEVLIKAPNPADDAYQAYRQEIATKYDINPNIAIEPFATIKKFTPEEIAKLDKLQEARGGTPFKSSHWDEPNVISHLRINLRKWKNKAVTFLEELQSDWAREGRENGFIKESTLPKEPTSKFISEDQYGYRFEVNGDTKMVGKGVVGSRKEAREYMARLAESDLKEKRLAEMSDAVPSHPLVQGGKWVEPTIKRALQEAVANNSEYFAWINGEQTSARYNLAKQVENVEWRNTTAQRGGKRIDIKPKGGTAINVIIDGNGSITSKGNNVPSDWEGKKLDEVLGKGLADSIMAKESGTLSGEGLKFGGEWATNLYDKQVKNIVEKLTGGKVVEMDMGLPIQKQGDRFLNLSTKKEIKPNELSVGNSVGKGGMQEGPDGSIAFEGEEYIITEVLGDGKFKAVPNKDAEAMRNISVDLDMPTSGMSDTNRILNIKKDKALRKQLALYEETFDISTKKTTQQGIKLTPEIVSKIKGEAPKIKTSGKMFAPKVVQERVDGKRRPTKTQIKAEAKKEVKLTQEQVIKTIEESKLPVSERGKFLRTVKNAQTTKQLEKVLKTVEERIGKATTRVFKGDLSKQVTKELKTIKPLKKGNRKEARYDYETNNFLKELAEINKYTKELAIEKLRNIPTENLTQADVIKNRLLSYKANGAKSSPALIANVLGDIQMLKEIGKEAKDDIDFQNKLEQQEKIDEVLAAINKQKPTLRGFGPFKKAYISSVANLYSTLNTIAGKHIADKYDYGFNQTDSKDAASEKIDSWTDEARNIYGVKNNGRLQRIFVNKLAKDDYIIKDVFGLTQKISKLEIMNMYNSIKNELLAERYDYAFGTDQVNALIQNLSPEDIKLADYLMEQVQEYRDIYNQKSIETTGLDMGIVENYWPSSSEYSPDVRDDIRIQGETPSATQERAKSSRVVPKMTNAWLVAQKHISQGEHVKTVSDKFIELQTIFSNRAVRITINDKYGDNAYKALMDHVETFSLNYRTQGIDVISGWYNTALNNWVKAKIFSPTVFPKQFISAVYSIGQVGPVKYIKYQTEIAKDPKKAFDFMWDNIPFLKARFRRGYSEALEDALRGTKNLNISKGPITNVVTAPTRSGDITAIILNGYPIMKSELAEGKTMEEAIKVTQKFTEKTQQSGTPANLSGIQRQKAFGTKVLTRFKNTLNQLLRLQVDANIQLINGQITKKDYMSQTFLYSFYTPIMYTLIGYGVVAAVRGVAGTGDDKDEEELLGNIMQNIVLQPLQAIPLLDAVWEAAYSKIREKATGKKAYYGVFSYPLFDDIEKAMSKLGKKEPTAMDYLQATSLIQEPITGIPTETLIRYFRYTQTDQNSLKRKYGIEGSITSDDNIKALKKMSQEEFEIYTEDYAENTMNTIRSKMYGNFGGKAKGQNPFKTNTKNPFKK